MTTLYLIRHGATAANELRPYILQGSGIDNALSEAGERQAASVAELLAAVPLDAVYCSHMRRAAQTAAAVAARQGLKPTPLAAVSLADLQEVHVGEWEGLSWDTIRERHPAAHDAFHATPGTAPYLGGESYADVLRRAEPVFAALYDKHRGGRIAVVAHNVVNRAYLSHLLGLDINLAKSLDQTNACVNVIRHDAVANRARVVTLNANFHVPGVMPAEALDRKGSPPSERPGD